MSDSQPASANRAVFLSYASQDAEAARCICESLRHGGVEVWFDADGGLEHGDEWDAKIRRQIKECVLFIPVISANTQAREEGYFRLEWDLAAERARTIASGVPFLLPVVIDDTREPEALVPDRFRTVQWTRLRDGEVPTEVQQRFLKLWSHRTGTLKNQSVVSTATNDSALLSPPPKPAVKFSKAQWFLTAAAALMLVIAVMWLLNRRTSTAPATSAAPATAISTKPVAAPAAAPLSEARQIAHRAQALIESLEGGRDDYRLAEELIAQAKAKDATDPEVCAIEAQIHGRFMQRGWDNSDARREAARAAVQRAIRLDPQSFEARFAQAFLLAYTGREGEERERQLRELRRERPTDQRVLRTLATSLGILGRIDESATIARESAALPGGDPLALYSLSLSYWFAGRANDAARTLEASLAQKPFSGALLMKVWFDASLRGDIASARKTFEKIDSATTHEDRGAFFSYNTEMLGRNPAQAIAALQALPRDWLNDNWYRGPKGLLLGDAHQLAGRVEAARIEWQAALKLVDQRLVDQPKDPLLLGNRVQLLARLGEREQAVRQFSVMLQFAGVDPDHPDDVPSLVTYCCIALGRNGDALRQIASYIQHNRTVAYPSATLRLNPLYDSLRSEPEFTRIVAEVAAREQAIAASAAVGMSDPAPPAPTKVEEKSVAVLAFANLSDDRNNEYFSDGISEELINALGKVSGLKVPARTSSFYFKGKSVPMPEIARQLGVAYVIEGSVQRAGEKVKISARLSKAADGFQVWTDSFLRDAKDVFAVEAEIAGLIGNQLSLKLGTSSAGATASVNPQALELYLQANQLMRLRDTIFGNTDRVEELLNRTLALEPNFTRAQAMLVEIWVAHGSLKTSSHSRFGQRHSPERERIEAKARQAIALDPMAPELHVALSLGLWVWWDRAGAENELRTALSLNPSLAAAHRQLGFIAMDAGRMDDAIAETNLAVQLDPFSQSVIESRARVLHVAGRYTEAIAAYDRALALADSGIAREHKAYALAQLGQKETAVALARSLPSEPARFRTLAAAGARTEAEAMFPTTDPENRSYYLFMLGRVEEGLAALDSEEMQSTYVHDVLFEPWYDPAREDPRFKKFLETLGVTEAHVRAQAWRQAHPPEKPAGK